MKLDILTHELDLSGAPRTAQEVANYLAKKGHQVRVIVVGGAGRVEPILSPDIERILFRCRRNGPLGRTGYVLTAMAAVARYLLSERPRMLMVWGKEFTIITTLLCRLLFIRPIFIGVGVSMIGRHLEIMSPLTRFFRGLVFKLCVPMTKAWIAQSKGVADELVEKYGVPRGSVTVIYPALQRKFFEVPLVQSDEKKLVFVGRLAAEKDPIRLLNNCHNFLKINKDWSLHILGDGVLRGAMETWVNDYDLAGRVVFHGATSDIAPHVQSARALLLTSRSEGFGMVLAEACALGVPVVSVNCPGGPVEIVKHGQNGYLVRNDQEFTAALEDLKTNRFDPKAVRGTMDKFHPDKVLAEYEEYLVRAANGVF